MTNQEAIKYLRQLYPYGGHCWLDKQRTEAIGMAIKALQEEPVKIKKGCKYRCLSDMVNKDTGNIAFIGDKIYLAPKDNTLVSEENGWLCDTSENASNFELVEEPVSEELEEAVDTYLATYFGSEKEKQEWPFLKKMAIHFAEWQKEKDESTTEDLGDYINELSKQFPEVSFAKLSRIAVRVAKWQKKQMVAKAGNGRVNSVSNRQTRAHITVVFDSPRDIEVLDRLKVIVIKEE